MKTQDDFTWVLEDTAEVRELQHALMKETSSMPRRVFFASLEGMNVLGYEVIDSFVCFCLRYDKKPNAWFWERMNSSNIHEHLVRTICKNQAYITEPMDIEPTEGHTLADSFLANFKAPDNNHIAFFSNCSDWDDVHPSGASFCVTDATFDRVIVGFTLNKIGFLLAEDED